MTKLSVVVITLNEETNLARCLESASWADEIIVVDTFSTDKTKEIAKKYAQKLYDLQWPGFGPAKQFALEKATCEWVLSLDADEVVSEPLHREINQILASQTEIDGYYICRHSNFLGKWIKYGWYPDYVLRLFRKDKGRFDNSLVHEELILKGTSARLKGALLHYTDPDLERYLTKMNRYTSLSAQALFHKGQRGRISDICLRPVALFLKIYFLKLGFLEGVHGLLLALFSSFHVLTKYAKLWHLNWQNK